ncbi:MAG: NupC/NupG family nucleoside CNT transporter [Proteobacteria bacterium]|nr:NupC/NupG family nucleoside CNT transporter [Pseudomonadota bacterium]
MERFTGIIGLVLFVAIAWVFSENRRKIDWRIVVWGFALQILLALFILRTSLGLLVFDAARVVMTSLLDFTDYGSRFLFGSLVSDFEIGAIVAFKVLPTIIFVSSLMGVLYYLRIVSVVVRAMAWVMERTMKVSGAEALMAAMFVFMGIESTTAIKEYLRKMTRSELFTVMVCFMSTIAGSVMAVYVSFGASAGHLLAASVMSAPAAIAISKIMVPETEVPVTSGAMKESLKSSDVNVIEAAANGAADGLKLALTIGAMLLAFVALIGMLDYMLKFTGTSFATISGYLFMPVAWVMGVPWRECASVGELLGIKVLFNEFISYQKMQGMITAGGLSGRGAAIATYALCSFANFGSIAILIGGIGTVAPERKSLVASLSMKALLAGLLAGFMTASIAGVLL